MGWTFERVEAEIVRLADQAHAKDDFCRAAGERIARVVEFDGSCWHTNDPATLLITSHLTERLPDRFEVIARNEYATDDVNHFAALAGSRRHARTLRGATRNRPESSPRYRDLLAPNGIEGELRAALVAGRSLWGGLILVRHAGRPDFSGDEADFLARLSLPLAVGLRTAIMTSATQRLPGPDAPGLFVIDERGEVQTMSESAAPWLDELCDGRDGPPPAVLATAAAARDAAPGHGPVRSRVRTSAGRWVVLHGTRVANAPGLAAVIAEPAGPADVAPLLLGAYGLTEREREVAELVLRGRSTAEIVSKLFISPYTVQDHLKAIFEKVGVRSRGDLMGRIFFEHHLPRIVANGAPAADGSLR